MSLIHGMLGETAARSPNAPAIVDGERTITYAELDQQSSRVAFRLLRLKLRQFVASRLPLRAGSDFVISHRFSLSG